MKSPDFDYIKVNTVEQALALLAEHGDDARILAGGQTLLATLNMRLSEPRLLIDITGLRELRRITVQEGRVFIGALATHTDIESSGLITEHAPLLAAAVGHIAHRAIRNSGTWGGSLAYGDPAAEWPCCLAALDGTIVLQSPRGQRRVAATDFFQDLYTTDLQPDEIVLGADFPAATTADWFAFDELARRHGDYAVAGLAVAARFQGTTATTVRLCFLGVANTPIRARQTEALLLGKTLDAATIASAVASLQTELDPMADLTHSAESKRHLATVLAKRLLTAAHASRSALAV
jgi:carbon-monoxide dehydrogenase medium subunit